MGFIILSSPCNCKQNSKWCKVVARTFAFLHVAGFLLTCFPTRVIASRQIVTEAGFWSDRQPKYLERKTKINVSMNVLRKMNLSVDPCENFYQFACQGWQKDNNIPKSRQSWNDFNEISQKTMDNLIHVIEEPISHKDMRRWKKIHSRYNSCLRRDASRKRKEFCISRIYGNQPLTVGHKYARKIYLKSKAYSELITEATKIFQNLKDSLKRLREETMFQKFDTFFTSQYINRLSLCIGFPSWIFNKTRVQIEENQIKKIRWRMAAEEKVKGLHGFIFSTGCQWPDYPESNMAEYRPKEFKIYIKSDYLVHTFAQYGHHMALNYGFLGHTLGHEIGHAFSERGLKTFRNGTLTSAAKCLVHQYNKFVVDELSRNGRTVFINGFGTLEENFSDNVGLVLAYNAYKKMSKIAHSPQSSGWPGLEKYSDDQLFFISFAQGFCALYTRHELKKVVGYSEHSPEMIRVLGTLHNSAEFAKAWNCPAGSKMNPDEKCNVFSR